MRQCLTQVSLCETVSVTCVTMGMLQVCYVCVLKVYVTSVTL